MSQENRSGASVGLSYLRVLFTALGILNTTLVLFKKKSCLGGREEGVEKEGDGWLVGRVRRFLSR